MLSPRTTYCVLLAGAFAWCAGFVAAPLLSNVFGAEGSLTQLSYEFYKPVCHQMDARSLHIVGQPFAVCSRCSAIYLSFLFAVIVFPLVRSIDNATMPSRFVLLLASLPMLVDAVGATLGAHTATMETRLITGSIFGFTLAFFIVPAILRGLDHSPEQSIPNHSFQKGFSSARKTV